MIEFDCAHCGEAVIRFSHGLDRPGVPLCCFDCDEIARFPAHEQIKVAQWLLTPDRFKAWSQDANISR